MKSITACPHCETQFYVDDSQLSQFNGKVRCGSCLKVFRAADHFVQNEQPEIPSLSAVTQEILESNSDSTSSAEPQTTELVNQPSNEENIAEEEALISPEGFNLKREPSTIDEALNEDLSDSDHHDEDDHSLMDSDHEVDENFIAKTESLIKNIDIDEVADRLQPSASWNSEPSITHKTQEDSPLGSSKDLIQQPEFSFKIDSPDTLDVLSKWRDETSVDINALDINEASDSHLETKSEPVWEANEKERPDVSISEPPSPMKDNFILPEATKTDEGKQAESTENDGYDFLLTEKEPMSPWMIGLAVLLVFVLLAQAVYYFRNTIAREMPEMKPVLQQLCEPIGCEISLPKQINLLSIDDSGIQQDANLKGVIRLTSTITNRAQFSQAYPKLEVTLTDERDQPKVRRVFEPKDYLQEHVNLADGIQSGESIPVEMALMTEAENVSGFRILLAY